MASGGSGGNVMSHPILQPYLPGLGSKDTVKRADTGRRLAAALSLQAVDKTPAAFSGK